MERLRQRADFLAAASGSKVPSKSFVLQTRKRNDDGPVRIGFTVSKKVGNAVERNRVRRRLREIVRYSDALRLQPGHDYVVIGRRTALNTPFEGLIEELDGALRRLHAARPEKSPSRCPVRDAQG
jgi:ribonuclease P protein component